MSHPSLSKVSELLQKINRLNENISSDGELSSLEIDLLTDYIRRLYEEVLQLKRNAGDTLEQPRPAVVPDIEEKEESAEAEEETVQQEEVEKEAAKQEEEVETEKPKPSIQFIPEEEEPQQSVEQNGQAQETEQEQQEEKAETEEQPKANPLPTKEEDTPYINEEWTGEETNEDEEEDEKEEDFVSLNDRFKKDHVSLAESMAQRDDLRDLIDINKRYLFISDLFNGDTLAYQAAIQRLNTQPNMQAAKALAEKELAPKYNWQEKDRIRGLFIKVLKKKFGEEV